VYSEIMKPFEHTSSQNSQNTIYSVHTGLESIKTRKRKLPQQHWSNRVCLALQIYRFCGLQNEFFKFI